MSQYLTGTNSLPRLIYPIIKLVRLGIETQICLIRVVKPLLYKPGQNRSPSMNVVKQAFAKKSTKACGAYLENFAVANY